MLKIQREEAKYIFDIKHLNFVIRNPFDSIHCLDINKQNTSKRRTEKKSRI